MAQMLADQIKADDKVSPKRHVLLMSRAEQILARLREAEALGQPEAALDSLQALMQKPAANGRSR